MKNLFFAVAILATSSMALANHVIECTDSTGQVITAHMETTNPSYANITITAPSVYNGYDNNTSGVVYNVPVSINSWGFSFDFQDTHSGLPDFNFKYSVNGANATLTQDDQSGAMYGAISWTRVDQPSNWTKLTGSCKSWEE